MVLLQGVGDLSCSIQGSTPPCWCQYTHNSSVKRPHRLNKARACTSRDLNWTGFSTAHADKQYAYKSDTHNQYAFVLSHGAGILQSTRLAKATFTRLPLASARSAGFTQEISVKEQYQTENNISIQKTAHISVRALKVEGLDDKVITSGENEDRKHSSPSTDNVATSAGVGGNSRKDDSATSESRQVTRSFRQSISDFKTWWDALHETYKSDTATWGYGASPIFTVYEGPDGKVERVTINEEEIKRRQGVEPLLAGLIDDASKAKAEENIMLAQSIARDLEQGRKSPNKYSTIFTVVKHLSEGTNQTRIQKLVNQVDVLAHRAAPIIKSVFMVAIPLYGISILYGAYLMITQQSDKDIVDEDKSAARLEKMRKLKAQMATQKGDSGVVQSPMAPSEFMQKLLEVREMARQVRTEEMLQSAGQDPSASSEHESRGEDLVDTKTVGDADEVEERVAEIEGAMMKCEIQDAETTTIGSREVLQSGSDTEVRSVLSSRVKPRIIMSIEEAMALRGEELIGTETVRDNDEAEEKVAEIDGPMTRCENSDTEATTMGSIELLQSGSDTAVGNVLVSRVRPPIIMSIEEAMAVIGEPKSLEKVCTASEKSQETTSEMVKSQTMPDLQLGKLERQNTEGRDVEVAANDVSRRFTGTSDQLTSEGQLDSQDTNNFAVEVALSDVNGRLTGVSDNVASEGQTREEQEGRETRVSEDSDGLKASDEAASLLGWKKASENGNLAEKTGMPPLAPSTQGGPNPSKRKEASPQPLSRKFTQPSILGLSTKDIVGSGQPLQGREPFSNTKRWSEELQRKYDSERDPEVRELMKEVGSELDSWVTEEEIEEAWRLSLKLQEGGEEDAVRKQYEKVQRKIQEEKEKFGLEAVMEKYKEYQPKPQDELWWLDLWCVLCLMVVSASKEEGGFYGLDMARESGEGKKTDQLARHVIAFEDPKDASNFGRLLELRSGSRFQRARVCPFSPKQLYRAAKEECFKVTVLRAGQIRTHIDQTLEEVEETILEIGRNSYLDKEEREGCIDIDSILHQRFGL